MKTRGRHILTFILSVLWGTGAAYATDHDVDREYEASQQQRHRDFNQYVNARKRSPELEAKAADALRIARKAEAAEQSRVQAEYIKTMKRYSMEEIEARDRADEERLAKEKIGAEKTRDDFIAVRTRRREIDARIGDVDPYQEFDIDMKKEPDSKVSHSSGAHSEE